METLNNSKGSIPPEYTPSTVGEEPRKVTYLYYALKELAGIASGVLLVREILLLFEFI